MATRQRLLEAARQSFESRGYGNSPTALISEQAGVSQATFYQYFSDRLAIMSALVTEHVAVLLGNTNLQWHIRDGRTGVDRMLTAYVTDYAATAAFSRVWEEVSHTDPDLAHLRRQLTLVVEAGVERELQRGLKDGLVTKVHDTRATARALTAMADRFCYLSYVVDPADPPIDPTDAASVLTEMWTNAIGLQD